MEFLCHAELQRRLERAQMMADVAGQLADQRMRRIHFELLPRIEILEKDAEGMRERIRFYREKLDKEESEVKSLTDILYSLHKQNNEAGLNSDDEFESEDFIRPVGDWSKKMIG